MPSLIDITGQRFGRLLVVALHSRGDQQGSRWSCLCDCGKTTIRKAAAMKRGSVRSCGCLARETTSRLRRHEYGMASMRHAYRNYINSAKKRNLSFNLTIETFRDITIRPCSYCGIEPEQVTNRPESHGLYVHNGIDRVDNGIGYESDNCVPCCKRCNRAKSNMSNDSWTKWLQRIVAYQTAIQRIT